ncbi:hypothetical protein F8E02_09725 [Methanoculleus sp. Wushi-C6]|uniref:Uncharacterized protein n=1 Tax=Methanoculleus caldifontis TaxID=2651577 RepID=A0ABU3X4D3_9EURY|nr:hypothetical protein [Methanoculleus sp. Wushi-C6]MDV2482271.1 hypothetical protein [Methanoculleus sp. Wushi-C6]
MDSTTIFLVVIMAVVIAGFAGILYFFRKIEQALAAERQSCSPGVTATQGGSGGAAQPLQRPVPSLDEIDPKKIGSLEEYLGAIGQKYGLASFTLATADGLLIGSTKAGAQGEAAQYSYLYTQGRLHDETGAELLGIPYRGETVIGIARPSEHLSADLMSALEQDTQDALRHWV